MYFCRELAKSTKNMAQNKFKGLGIALVTPFKSDGSIDYEALVRLVEYQIKNGVDFPHRFLIALFASFSSCKSRRGRL